MKEIGKILLYLALTVVLGALLAPPLYWAGQWVASRGVMVFLAETEFQRFFNRAVLIAALLLLWPTVRWLKIRSLAELGLKKNPQAMRHLVAGFVISGLFLLLMSTGLLMTDAYRLKGTLPWDKLPKLAVTAVTVALLEEALFRGAIQGLIQRSLPRYATLSFVSALFAVIHFLKPRDEHLTKVGWSSGFELLPDVFWQFGEPLLLAAGCFTLFVGGWILGYARLRTKSLWMPVGLHIGFIFFKMGFNKFSRRSDELLPWFGPDLFIGLGPVLVLMATALTVWWWLNHEADSGTAKTRS